MSTYFCISCIIGKSACGYDHKNNHGICKLIQQKTVKCSLIFPFQKICPATLSFNFFKVFQMLTHQYLKTSFCVLVKQRKLFLHCSVIKLARTVEYFSVYSRLIGLLYTCSTASENISITIKYLRWDKKFVCKRERSPILWRDISQIYSFFLKFLLAVNCADALSAYKITAISLEFNCQAQKSRQLRSGCCCQASSSYNRQ